MPQRKVKPMPEKVAKQLSAAERIKAHFESSYELSDEDQEYLHDIDLAFRVTFGEPDRNDAREKIKHLFPKKTPLEIQHLIRDVGQIYGDYFEVSKTVMKVLQEKRHMRVYQDSCRQGEMSAANRALTAIDKLYDLYTPDKNKAKARKLPAVRRTNDPKALETITGTDD